MSKRVNVNFSDEIFRELERIARERGKSLSDVLRDAVTLEKYVAEARRGGGRVVLESSTGEQRELLVR